MHEAGVAAGLPDGELRERHDPMGAWGTGLFEDDVSVDVKLAFEEALEAGASIPAATKQVLDELGFDELGFEADDEDDGPIVVLALAALQWERGKPQEKLRKRAIDILERGRGLERWADEGEALLAERQATYDALHRLLTSPPPAPARRPRRPRPKINFREGDWFGVPLEGGGFAIGLVARYRKGYGPGVFGYFFGPRRAALPSVEELHRSNPAEAIYTCVFSYLGLMQSEWPLVGRAEPWDPARWPLPLFQRQGGMDGQGWLVRYSEDSLEAVEEWRVDATELQGLPEDGSSGYGAVEMRLSRLLPAP